MVRVLMTSLEVGLIFAVLAMGVLFTFKILDIADLSVEGTFPLGAFVYSALVMKGLHPYLGMFGALVAGGVAGYLTFLLYRKLNIAAILAGILTMTILYSVNLRIVGKANIPLFDYGNVFSQVEAIPPVIILGILVILIKATMDWFFKTEMGYRLIVTGDNATLLKNMGGKPDSYICLGLILSNALVSLAGSLMAQYQGFADAQMGATIIVTALASIIIGETLFSRIPWMKPSSRAIVGAVIYKIISGMAIELGLEPTDLKMITAFIVILFLSYDKVPRMKKIMGNKQEVQS
ncbi:MAG: ABC transporter permease [Tissierellia bacterium]|nr:ABC transporter permease [Tissierellia bacterium]